MSFVKDFLSRQLVDYYALVLNLTFLQIIASGDFVCYLTFCLVLNVHDIEYLHKILPFSTCTLQVFQEASWLTLSWDKLIIDMHAPTEKLNPCLFSVLLISCMQIEKNTFHSSFCCHCYNHTNWYALRTCG